MLLHVWRNHWTPPHKTSPIPQPTGSVGLGSIILISILAGSSHALISFGDIALIPGLGSLVRCRYWVELIGVDDMFR